ncbi:MAG: hypothetical protein Kow00111_09550 [Thermincola ferriacetica]
MLPLGSEQRPIVVKVNSEEKATAHKALRREALWFFGGKWICFRGRGTNRSYPRWNYGELKNEDEVTQKNLTVSSLLPLLYFTKNIAIIITAKRERRFIMPNIKPISDLRNYNEVLRCIEEGSPVFLTKNGRGRYVVMDMQEYEKMQAKLKLLTELAKGEKAGRENGWLTIDELEASLGVTNG